MTERSENESAPQSPVHTIVIDDLSGFRLWQDLTNKHGCYPEGVENNDRVDIVVRSDEPYDRYAILTDEPARYHDWRCEFTDIVAWRLSR